jgi:NitT/TauT family transport system ATP-binding protein
MSRRQGAQSQAIQDARGADELLRLARDDAAPLVSMRRVGKAFHDRVALRALDLDVVPGETLTLLGPSGCGKSTALRLLAGLAQPTSGEILWTGAASRERLGFVFQEATLLPWADVADNVYLPLRLAGVGRGEAAPRVEEALELVGLAPFARALPRELSGGMKMRCAIARALVTRPALLLMDEPFAALDEVTREKLNDELLALKARLHATIVFVTHSVLESAFLSTRIVVLSARGGAIADEIDVEPELRRDAEFRLSPEFAQICRRASGALRRAMGEESA